MNGERNIQAANVQQYLDSPGMGYLLGINGVSVESLIGRTREISRLRKHLPHPQILVSVGVGEGEEIHAMHALYQGSEKKIIGIDLSPLALNAARERSVNNDIPAEFILGSATELPLKTESVDGILLSSLMHEVYSYSPEGKESWNKSVKDSARVLSEGGCMLLRDSAAPDLQGSIQVRLTSDLARQFYPYFIREYRGFDGWDELRGKFTSNLPAFPEADDSYTVNLSAGQAAELLFHFVNFEMGYPNDKEFIGNKRWKELNETYYVPKDAKSPDPMSIDEYVAEVIAQGNIGLEGTGFQLICVEQELSVRPRMARPLSENFLLALPGTAEFSTERSSELISKFINKMELIFKKVNK